MEREYTKKEKLQNWFYYNKWYLALALLLLGMAASWIHDVQQEKKNQPDYQFAYVGSVGLPQSAVEGFEAAVAQIGTDVNGDGTVRVKLQQHISGDLNTEPNAVYAMEVKLMADLAEGESAFFLLEDPEQFQKAYKALTDEEALPWDQCPGLTSLDLGTFQETLVGETVTVDAGALFSELYLGRRPFYDRDPQERRDAYEALWEKLTREG